MDVEDARTFLEIIAAGNFFRAAKRLNVTQSTVSTRIKTLEDRLGSTLFVRSKAGASLTPAGLRFRRHAEAMLKAWRQAQQEVALPPDYRAILTVGGQFSLWDRLLLKWLSRMRRAASDIALRAEVGQPDDLIRQISEGLLDLGVMYSPQSRPGLAIEELLVDTLVLVGTNPGACDIGDADYVYVDWGAEFQTAHGRAYPDGRTPGLSVGLGALALQHILAHGGTAYFPARVIAPRVASGELHVIAGAPTFARPAFAVYKAGFGDESLAAALGILRDGAAEDAESAEALLPAGGPADD